MIFEVAYILLVAVKSDGFLNHSPLHWIRIHLKFNGNTIFKNKRITKTEFKFYYLPSRVTTQYFTTVITIT